MNIIPNYDSNGHLLKLVNPQRMSRFAVVFFFVSVSVTALSKLIHQSSFKALKMCKLCRNI